MYKATQTFWSYGPCPAAPNVLVPTNALIECIYSCMYSSDYKVIATGEEFQLHHTKALKVLEDMDREFNKYLEDIYDTSATLTQDTAPVEIMVSKDYAMDFGSDESPF